MSDTPRTDAAVLDEHDPTESVGYLCRQLERELTAAREIASKYEDRYFSTQAELTAAQGENAKLQERVEKREKAMHALAAIIGPPGKQTWATDDHLNKAWELYFKTKDTQ